MERKTVRNDLNTFFEGEGSEEIEMPVRVMMERLQTILDGVPEVFRDVVVLRMKAYGEYASLDVSAYYDRSETDVEMLARGTKETQQAARDAEYTEQHEKAQYLRLKAKFEP